MDIADRVAGWVQVVPEALATKAATVLCGDPDAPCKKCIEEAASILAWAYCINEQSKQTDPCLACELVRANPNSIHEYCLFHWGVYQGVVDGLDPSMADTVEEEAPEPTRFYHLTVWSTVWWGRIKSWVVKHLTARAMFLIWLVIGWLWIAIEVTKAVVHLH